MTDARDDLVERLRIKADMILMGEGITWGSDSEVMREAATRIQQLTARAEAAEASLAEAERVMEPFAEPADALNNVGDNAIIWSIPGEITAANFRAARAWLDSRRKEQT